MGKSNLFKWLLETVTERRSVFFVIVCWDRVKVSPLLVISKMDLSFQEVIFWRNGLGWLSRRDVPAHQVPAEGVREKGVGREGGGEERGQHG